MSTNSNFQLCRPKLRALTHTPLVVSPVPWQSPAGKSSDDYGDAEACLSSIEAVTSRGITVDLCHPSLIAGLMYQQNLHQGQPGYRWTRDLATPPKEVTSKKGIVSVLDWQLDAYNVVSAEHLGATALVSRAWAHIGGHLERCVEAVRAICRGNEVHPILVAQILSATRAASLTSSLFALEDECRRIESNWNPEELENGRLKLLAAAACLLGVSAARSGAAVLDLAAGSDARAFDRCGATLPILDLIVGTLAADPGEVSNVALYDLATAMWAVSFPESPRVFLSQRGPEFRKIATEKLKRFGLWRPGEMPGGPLVSERTSYTTFGPNLDKQQASVGYFLDNAVAPLQETCRGFVWRQLWESHHFHAFVTPGYFKAKWCVTELQLWRYLTKRQQWRSCSMSLLCETISSEAREFLPEHAIDIDSIFTLEDPKVNVTVSFDDRKSGRIHSRAVSIGEATATSPFTPFDMNLLWQRIVDLTHVACYALCQANDQIIYSSHKHLHDFLTDSVSLIPGTQGSLERVARIASELGEPSTVGWLVYVAHAAVAKIVDGVMTPIAELIDRIFLSLPAIARSSLISNRSEADEFLAMLYGWGIGRDVWVIRQDTPDDKARLILLGLVTGLAGDKARLEQINDNILTNRIVGGIRLGMLPSFTGESYVELCELTRPFGVRAQITGIAQLQTLDRFGESIDLARELRLNVEAKPADFGPFELGRIRLLELKGLHRERRYAEAYALYNNHGTVFYMYSEPSGSYLSSIMAEIAFRLDEPTEAVISFCNQCIELRRGAADIEWAAEACITACFYLELRDQEFHNEKFARMLLEFAELLPDQPLLPVDAYSHLLSNSHRARDDRSLQRVLIEIRREIDLELPCKKELEILYEDNRTLKDMSSNAISKSKFLET